MQVTAKLIHPVFNRIRTDKKNNKDDIPFSQISKIVFIPEGKSENTTLSKSELVFREVYKKEAKDKIMVQKFLVWKTNKEKENPRFPAYVLAYSNFSSSRKEPLQREVRISNNKDQIMSLLSAMQEQNIKKGWEKVES